MKNPFKFLILITILMIPKLSHAQAKDSLENTKITLDVMIGQMIMTGIGDQSYVRESDDIVEEIQKGYVGGIIYFEKNINKNSPKDQLIRGVSLLNDAAKTPLFVSIDEEGGRVNRLKPKYGFPVTKQAGYLGELNNLDTTRYYANQTASTLKELGFNLNYAPDVDVAINPKNPVIANLGRSYSDNPDIVASMAAEVVKAHHENGVLTVLKHFPGHGSSHNDSHLGVADVTNYWQFSELMPYKSLLDSGYVDAIMTAHIVNKHLDPDGLPATLSPFVISNILRNFLEYNGVVFSDDMQMHAISSNFGFEQSIKLAILAGVDVLMFANNVPGNEKRSATEIHKIIKSFVENGEITEERIAESYERIILMKAKM